jgi:hypothetical protein
MSTLNLYRELLALLPSSPLLVGQVITVATGAVTVQFPGGGTQVVRGVGYSVGAQVFVRDGLVEGAAPALPLVTIEV